VRRENLSRKYLRFLLALLFVILLVSACTGQNPVTGDQEEPPGASSEEEPITRGTSELEVIVSEERAAEKDLLTVVKNEGVAPFGESQASDVFEIAGLENLSEPITVQIETNRELTGETYVALGIQTYVRSMDREMTGYQYLDCDVEGNTVTFTLDPEVTGTQSVVRSGPMQDLLRALLRPRVVYAEEAAFVQATVITNQKSSTGGNGRYKIISETSVRDVDLETLEAFLIYCESFYGRMGVDFDGYDKWPLEIKVLENTDSKTTAEEDKKPQAAFTKTFWLGNVWIELREDLLEPDNMDEMRSSVIHEYFHFVQDRLYDSKSLWFDEATAVWSEEYYRENSGHIPSVYQVHGERSLQVYDGPINHADRGEDLHGYGSWAYIKYLVPTAGEGATLIDVYKAEKDKQTPVEILNTINPVNTWIGDFYTRLYTGTLSPKTQTGPGKFRASAPSVTIDLDQVDQPTTQQIEVPGYGARVLMVALTAEDPTKVPPHMKLKIKGDPQDAYLGLVRNTPIDEKVQLLDAKAGVVSTEGLNGLLTDRWAQQLSVIVVNTSETTKPIQLELTLDATDLWEYTNLKSISGSAVINWGANAQSDLRNMFGYISPGLERGVTLFADGSPAGTMHFVEWETKDPVTIKSFQLAASHDRGPVGPSAPDEERDARHRGFSHVRLQYWDGGGWQTFYETATSNPYGQGDHGNYLVIKQNVPEFTAGRFRAEFTQYGDHLKSAAGPRIIELDGYGSPIE
jgi:hypothetical protein